MFKSRVYPVNKKSNSLLNFKKSIIEKMSNDLDNYEAFKIENPNKSEYILIKKNSIQYNILTNILKLNKTIYVNEFDN